MSVAEAIGDGPIPEHAVLHLVEVAEERKDHVGAEEAARLAVLGSIDSRIAARRYMLSTPELSLPVFEPHTAQLQHEIIDLIDQRDAFLAGEPQQAARVIALEPSPSVEAAAPTLEDRIGRLQALAEEFSVIAAEVTVSFNGVARGDAIFPTLDAVNDATEQLANTADGLFATITDTADRAADWLPEAVKMVITSDTDIPHAAPAEPIKSADSLSYKTGRQTETELEISAAEEHAESSSTPSSTAAAQGTDAANLNRSNLEAPQPPSSPLESDILSRLIGNTTLDTRALVKKVFGKEFVDGAEFDKLQRSLKKLAADGLVRKLANNTWAGPSYDPVQAEFESRIRAAGVISGSAFKARNYGRRRS